MNKSQNILDSVGNTSLLALRNAEAEGEANADDGKEVRDSRGFHLLGL